MKMWSLVFFLLAIYTWIVDVIGTISIALEKEDNYFSQLLLRKKNTGKEKEVLPILIMKIGMMTLLICTAIFFYTKSNYPYALILLGVNMLINSFFTKSLFEIIH